MYSIISLAVCLLVVCGAAQGAKVKTGDKLKNYLQKTREMVQQEIDKLGGVLSPSTGTHTSKSLFYDIASV